ncbi:MULTISPECIES: hypothetical protein [Streptosporangium]|uniref:Uncharacterized protein n=1 Tax=Streptosporangium brasiliense TaxID=47480 RepID=A0ABT9REY8_9ACTN|nr:hypothetical protein [Streptosporangium brasiliense]MDP9867827.1 hypothetical protein [Streptosporangium brasiliense]
MRRHLPLVMSAALLVALAVGGRAAGVEQGGRIHAVKTMFDGSGLEAAVRPGQALLGPLPETGVPVTVVEHEPVRATSHGQLIGQASDKHGDSGAPVFSLINDTAGPESTTPAAQAPCFLLTPLQRERTSGKIT